MKKKYIEQVNETCDTWDDREFGLSVGVLLWRVDVGL